MTRPTLAQIKANFETGDVPNGADYAQLIDTLASQSTELGTAGNNEETINGIENTTTIDTFVATQWRMVKYLVSIKYSTTKFYATEFTILMDASGVNVSQYGVIDNDGDIGTVSVSRTGDSVNLVVTPNPAITPVTVRFARMGLKA
jgi:DNA polymerase/3'-5' exonuclease PolX